MTTIATAVFQRHGRRVHTGGWRAVAHVATSARFDTINTEDKNCVFVDETVTPSLDSKIESVLLLYLPDYPPPSEGRLVSDALRCRIKFVYAYDKKR